MANLDYELFYKIFFPYAFQKLDDGKYVVINREYQPLGYWPERFGEPTNKRGQSFYLCGDLDEDLISQKNKTFIYLYDDSTNPMVSVKTLEAYLEKIGELSYLWCPPIRSFSPG
jgi:hypothetical protein